MRTFDIDAYVQDQRARYHEYTQNDRAQQAAERRQYAAGTATNRSTPITPSLPKTAAAIEEELRAFAQGTRDAVSADWRYSSFEAALYALNMTTILRLVWRLLAKWREEGAPDEQA